MMEITLDNYQLEMFTDDLFDPKSADNVKNYDAVYYSENSDYISSKHALVIKKDDDVLKSAILLCSGGGTGVHDKSYRIADKTIYMCGGNSLFSLSLPELSLNWVKEVDWATAFRIFELSGDFLIHGELSISRITKKGEIIWQQSGSDIFVNLDGRDCCYIRKNIIYAESFDERKYKFDFDGNIL
ncbi:hypothetical protein [Breznakiella homolactica]|uniref:Uncharacterized protein n=1 Tax=Breznakiella homolactica TaxID=2798577 RepID=A0A7T7XJP4_9SPIR|nr:hypothetical protein [Breznakiella homolactica]QQO07665.1 hypothetical protein JFL75_11985 [Breznakiella homolactica]